MAGGQLAAVWGNGLDYITHLPSSSRLVWAFIATWWWLEGPKERREVFKGSGGQAWNWQIAALLDSIG